MILKKIKTSFNKQGSEKWNFFIEIVIKIIEKYLRMLFLGKQIWF